MPTGFFIMYWNEKFGAEIKAKYPPSITIKDNTLLQIYSQHEYSGKAGFVTLSSDISNIISYYTGPEANFYLILSLLNQEDGNIFEEALRDIAPEIVKDAKTDEFQSSMESYYQKIILAPTATEEQQLTMIVRNPMLYQLLIRLRDEIAISRTELEVWLKNAFRGEIIDLDSIIFRLVKTSLVKIASIKGLSADVLFLVNDIIMFRRPPVSLIQDSAAHNLPTSFNSQYFTEVKEFFRNYIANDEDIIKVMKQIILHPQYYQILIKLRQQFLTRKDLEEFREKNPIDIDSMLSLFKSCQLITILHDKSTEIEYYGLLSDLYIAKIYPTYNLNTINHLYAIKVHTPQVLLTALNLMQETYTMKNHKF